MRVAAAAAGLPAMMRRGMPMPTYVPQTVGPTIIVGHSADVVVGVDP